MRTKLFHILFLVTLAGVAPAGAQLRPSSDLLLPYFEVALEGAPTTTLFAVGNHLGEDVEVVFAVHTNWGIPVLSVPVTLPPHGVQSVNLRSWIAGGEVPGRKLGADEHAHLKAALAGQRSPKDGLYYGTAVAQGLAVGYVTIRTQGSRPDALWGDTFAVDLGQDFASGDNLVNIDRGAGCQGLCDRHSLRFLSGAGFDGGTLLVIWTGRTGHPSATPGFPAGKVRTDAGFYDEKGHLADERRLETLPVELIKVADLDLSQPFGWVDLDLDEDAFIGVRYSSHNRYSVGLQSYCLPPPEIVTTPGPGLRLRKRTNGVDANQAPGPAIAVGRPVTWEYEVTNTGNVPLSGLALNDDREGAVHCPKSRLAAGETMTCTASGVVAACQYRNLGTVVGTAPDGEEVTAEDASHYFGTQNAALDVELSVNGQDADAAPGPTVRAGDTLTWVYVVTNRGDVALSQVAVTDGGAAVRCPKNQLKPDESMTCTVTGPAAAGPAGRTAVASGTPPCGPAVADEDPAHYTGFTPDPGIRIRKLTNGHDANQAPGPAIALGAPVLWEYQVTNTGQVALANVRVTDDQGVAVACPKTTLQPAESMTCTGSGTAAACQYRNVGTATGTPPSGPAVSHQDPSHYFGQHHAAIRVEQAVDGHDADTAPGPTFPAGAALAWTYVVTNTGDVALTGVQVTDARGVAVSCPKTSLQPGESMTCTGASAAAAGAVASAATAAGTPPCGPAVGDDDPTHYTGQEQQGGQGCTPGYWKNHTDSWPPTGYSPSQKVESVFQEADRYPALGSASLLQGLSFQGGPTVEGAAGNLLRAAIASLLDSAHPGVSYPRTTAQVIASVDAALASGNRDTMLGLAAGLDADNNLGCPLN